MSILLPIDASIFYERTFSKVYKLKIELDFSMRERQKCEIFYVNSGNFSNTTVFDDTNISLLR